MKICKSYKDIDRISITNSKGLSISFLRNGALSSISYKNLMINLFEGNPIDDSLNNIFVRIHIDSKIVSAPLLGPTSKSSVFKSSNSIEFEGTFGAINYKCICMLADNENVWFWKVYLSNDSVVEVKVDLIYVQDIGIADKNAIKLNEAYTSQYIDHQPLKHSQLGYAIASRQNQLQTIENKKVFPWVLQGGLETITSYLTDGFDFYGTNYKFDNHPQALSDETLSSVKRQYELSLIVLQTQITPITPGSKKEFTFYGYFIENHKDPSSDKDLQLITKVKKISQTLKPKQERAEHKIHSSLFTSAPLFKIEELDDKDVESLFGKNLRHEEKANEKLLSFFYDNEATTSCNHVVLPEKERIVERPHGHIMISNSDTDYSSLRLSTTSYMYGLFNSHITLGNTSFNKGLTITRTPLNLFKSCGQRIFVKLGSKFKLLGVPSAFEIGMNHCIWYYKIGKNFIIVKTWTSADNVACFLNISVSGDAKYEFIITNNILAGNNEYDSSPSVQIDDKFKLAEIVPDENELLSKTFPNSKFYIVCSSPDDVETACLDEFITDNSTPSPYPFITYKTFAVNNFTLAVTGMLESKDKEKLIDNCLKEMHSFESSCRASEIFWKQIINNFKLELPSSEYISKINDMVAWYTHNAMIHFLSPHGLEQYSGAAWGTRDVSQGPVEFFLSANNHSAVKKILLEIYSHQYEKTGTWPQWFMFDSYRKIQQEESHGDVIVWPLKVFCDFVSASGDYAILSEKIPYTDVHGFDFTNEKYTLLEHLKKEIQYIKDNFIKGTSLSCYGDGDWDDTLQPANPELRKKMVSGWTTLLTYQTLLKASDVFTQANLIDLSRELGDIAVRIRENYNKFLIKDGIAGGFAYFKDSRNVDLMVHPSDKATGIKYRLLPMTRGIISELFTREQADLHIKTIREQLYCPDGVRLMDTPAKYIGGPNKYFKRAEQAANVGREISLQYAHAHIRFIEAMAKYGDAKEVFKAINTINPIGITQFVKNAQTRQSNSYFSSSDPAFNDRYEAQENFAKVRKGEVKVKGGWRIYSSGPGIFINQIISNFLGFRVKSGHIEIDPVMPFELDGLSFHFDYEEKKLAFKYSIKKSEFSPYQILINGKDVEGIKYLDNPYRKGGALITKDIFDKLISIDKINIIEIKM